ncbi:LOW QUALITY PROTEIN: uncharacterized protein LOC111674125 [Orussus abietinus]|uniref:LOW QUALITY PROTEIN: uncharacterized protein LOC111674125 n=1 Tax=Orussus abietinus TaxID=222816 RepID=UPI000C715B8C|nr:LOW QUALITY PROTEIN: uncharacterized protein LOC111674125 [Orussus abietinus]
MAKEPTPTDLLNLTYQHLQSADQSSRIRCIQSALKEIPTFDGEEPPLAVFLQHLENGLTLIGSQDEGLYLTAVLTKLTGAARASVEGKGFTTRREFTRHLKKRFAPYKNYASALKEVEHLGIRENESIRQYLNRKQLGRKAKTAIPDSDEQETKNCKENLDKSLLSHFICGLPVDAIPFVVVRQPKTLDEAFEAALEIEKIRQERRVSHDSPGREDYRRDYRDHSYTDYRSPHRESRYEQFERNNRKYVSYPQSPRAYDRYPRHSYERSHYDRNFSPGPDRVYSSPHQQQSLSPSEDELAQALAKLLHQRRSRSPTPRYSMNDRNSSTLHTLINEIGKQFPPRTPSPPRIDNQRNFRPMRSRSPTPDPQPQSERNPITYCRNGRNPSHYGYCNPPSHFRSRSPSHGPPSKETLRNSTPIRNMSPRRSDHLNAEGACRVSNEASAIKKPNPRNVTFADSKISNQNAWSQKHHHLESRFERPN